MRRKPGIAICLVIAVTLLVSPAEAQAGGRHSGLDPTPLVEWFGGRVTSGFRDPARPYHVGVDFSLVTGTPIPATWEGTVTYVGWYGDFGNVVVVQKGDWQMRYCHLSRFAVGVGQQIQTGTVVGLSGNTGVSTGPHLHYEVRRHGVAVDPMTAPGLGNSSQPVGNYIELHAMGHARPDLWTVVQWQHPDGSWRDVAGWQGNLELAGGIGVGRWWVAEDDLGKGPFRWLVYQSKGSRLLAQSGPFYLPSGGRAVIVAAWVP